MKEELTPEQKKILQEKETEPPGTGKHLHEKREGTYTCAQCGKPIFSSEDKYESNTGWPSYTKPISKDATKNNIDFSHGTVKREVICSNCGGHLGHVFHDGPAPRFTRYCINSAAMNFKPIK